jgi:predicted transcriptional regulator
MDEYRLFDAEFKFVSIIWKREPINSTELTKVCLNEIGWKKSTTFNMIRKLVERGILQNENAIVTTLVKKEQVQKYESETLLNKAFDGSLPGFLAAFLKDKKLTKKEADEIKRMIEEASK